MQPPAVLWNDAPLRCLAVNEEWASHILGLLYIGEREAYWDSDEQVGQQGMAAIADALAIGDCEQLPMPIPIYHARHTEVQGTSGGGYVNGITQLPFDQAAQVGNNVADQGNDTWKMAVGQYHIRAKHVIVAHSTNNTNFRVSLNRSGVQLFEGGSTNLIANGRGFVFGDWIITCNDANDIWKLNLHADQARATNGLGQATNLVTTEVYGDLIIKRIGN